MSDFKRIYDELVSGIDSFEFVPIADILIWPEGNNLRVEEYEIQLKPGRRWFVGFQINDSLSYSEEPDDNDNGRVYKKMLEGILPQDHYEMAEFFFNNLYTHFIVKYFDRTGTRRLLGSPEEPMRLDFSFSQAASPSGTKGWKFSFYGNHVTPALYLTLPSTQFYIDSNGYLIYNQGLDEDFNIVSGKLEVTGTQEDQYFLTNNGQVNFSTNP